MHPLRFGITKPFINVEHFLRYLHESVFFVNYLQLFIFIPWQ